MHFERRSDIPVPASELYAWHTRPGAFERLVPPWQDVRVLRREGSIHDGDRIDLRVGPGLGATTWKIEHRGHRTGEAFEDHLLSGPFRSFRHRHLFESIDAERSRLIDAIDFELPAGWLSEPVAGWWIRQQLGRAFAWRHAITRDDLSAHARFGGARMSVAVSGSTGLIGRSLCAMLTTGGHAVHPLVRHDGKRLVPGGIDPVRWSWEHQQIESNRLDGLDAVVHLAAEPILGNWTPEKKRLIRESRVMGTRLISETLARLRRKPSVLVVASAIGIYGDRGDEVLDETSSAGEGFLPEVAAGWESATRPAEDAGIRVVHARIGLVMTPRGAALAQMLLPFRMGAGGPLGDGRAWWSWVELEDVVGALHHALMDEAIRGAVNVVSPEPVRQGDFARSLGRALWRPSFVPTPRFMVRLAFGRELADAALLGSQRVLPEKLTAAGYRFRQPDLSAMLRTSLGIEETA
ncbi:TIGR01777 family oxidoreductase [Mucisphaera calidilacus]|uniref:Epimerase family protein n=1 Tax=Mucisphaera calidilacus TaxID=2527982 RepID=A0A518BVH9_9BACT|nr:TIGR01777 family oxidoreductase [Mucisphaera calidilacus]QDU70976.1 Epimerase family protein [Mucisphaera calidilacus]